MPADQAGPGARSIHRGVTATVRARTPHTPTAAERVWLSPAAALRAVEGQGRTGHGRKERKLFRRRCRGPPSGSDVSGEGPRPGADLKGTTVKYMLMIYNNPATLQEMTEEERNGIRRGQRTATGRR